MVINSYNQQKIQLFSEFLSKVLHCDTFGDTNIYFATLSDLTVMGALITTITTESLTIKWRLF